MDEFADDDWSTYDDFGASKQVFPAIRVPNTNPTFSTKTATAINKPTMKLVPTKAKSKQPNLSHDYASPADAFASGFEDFRNTFTEQQNKKSTTDEMFASSFGDLALKDHVDGGKDTERNSRDDRRSSRRRGRSKGKYTDEIGTGKGESCGRERSRSRGPIDGSKDGRNKDPKTSRTRSRSRGSLDIDEQKSRARSRSRGPLDNNERKSRERSRSRGPLDEGNKASHRERSRSRGALDTGRERRPRDRSRIYGPSSSNDGANSTNKEGKKRDGSTVPAESGFGDLEAPRRRDRSRAHTTFCTDSGEKKARDRSTPPSAAPRGPGERRSRDRSRAPTNNDNGEKNRSSRTRSRSRAPLETQTASTCRSRSGDPSSRFDHSGTTDNRRELRQRLKSSQIINAQGNEDCGEAALDQDNPFSVVTTAQVADALRRKSFTTLKKEIGAGENGSERQERSIPIAAPPRRTHSSTLPQKPFTPTSTGSDAVPKLRILIKKSHEKAKRRSETSSNYSSSGESVDSSTSQNSDRHLSTRLSKRSSRHRNGEKRSGSSGK